MSPLAESLAHHPFLGELSPAQRERLSAIVVPSVFEQGAVIAHAGAPAEQFFLLIEGRVSLELEVPGRDESVLLETVRAPDVIGWSWALAPHRWAFTVRAHERSRALVLDAARLRAAMEEDPALGFALMKGLLAVVAARLGAARVRLLDLYGAPR